MVKRVYNVPIASNFRGPVPNRAVIKKYIEDGNRTNRQKQSYFYATERYRDLKIMLNRIDLPR